MGRRKQEGNIANIMVTGIFILAMMVVMLAFFEDISWIRKKAQIDQLCRTYILRMETVGRLCEEDRTSLVTALAEAGMTQIELDGSTLEEVGYGEKITLVVTGLLGDTYEIYEKKVSTAKH